MDGTLIDSEPTHYKALDEVLKSYGKSYVDWETHKKEYTGTGIGHVSKTETKRNNLNEDPEIIQEKFHKKVEDLVENEGLIPMGGSIEFLNKAKEAGFKLAVVSGSTTNLVKFSLGKSGMPDVFDIVIGVDKFGAPKPDPAAYLMAAELLGVNPKECMSFEDAPNGLLSAKNAGTVVVAIGQTISKEQIEKIDPSIAHLKDFTEIEITS